MIQPDYSTFDKSLGMLRPYGPDLKNGLANHVPMAAEALCAMGLGAAAEDWVKGHLITITERPSAPFKLDPRQWRTDLAKPELFSDWQRYFEMEIEALGWEKALDKWAARLAPGLFASATHGIIRAAHAARSLRALETDLRKSELADGLAVWAATYQPLPTSPQAAPRYHSVAEAFKHLPRIPPEYRKTDGLITDALAHLSEIPEFAELIGWVDFSKNPGASADELAVCQAHTFLHNVTTPLHAIVFTHAITSVHAVLNIAPHVSDNTVRDLLAYGWQAGAALYAGYAEDATDGVAVPGEEAPDVIAEAAAANGDDHVIKLSEACLAFYERTGAGVFLSVPSRARSLLPIG